jgi:hypothetical protein
MIDPSPSFLSYLIPLYGYFKEINSKFTPQFVTLLALCNANQGLGHMVSLSTQNYFKQYLHLEPGVMAGLISLIYLPWSTKIFYGLLSDNFPLFGTKRKSYCVLLGLL